MKLNDKFIVDNKNDKLRRKKNVTDINKDNIDGGKKFFPPKYVSNTMEIHFPFNLLNEVWETYHKKLKSKVFNKILFLSRLNGVKTSIFRKWFKSLVVTNQRSGKKKCLKKF